MRRSSPDSAPELRSGSCPRQPTSTSGARRFRGEAGSDLASLRTTAVPRRRPLHHQRPEAGPRSASTRTGSSCLARTDRTHRKKRAGISFPPRQKCPLPGSLCRQADRQQLRGPTGLVRDIPASADQLVGRRTPAGATRSSCSPTRQGSPGRLPASLAHEVRAGGQTPLGTGAAGGSAVRRARVASGEPTARPGAHQLRVSGDEGGDKPNPASSILKLRGSQLQQAGGTELMVEVAGPDGLPFDAPDAVDSLEWAQHAAPRYLNYRKTSIYGGSSGCSAPSSPRRFSDCEQGRPRTLI